MQAQVLHLGCLLRGLGRELTDAPFQVVQLVQQGQFRAVQLFSLAREENPLGAQDLRIEFCGALSLSGLSPQAVHLLVQLMEDVLQTL